MIKFSLRQRLLRFAVDKLLDVLQMQYCYISRRIYLNKRIKDLSQNSLVTDRYIDVGRT